MAQAMPKVEAIRIGNIPDIGIMIISSKNNVFPVRTEVCMRDGAGALDWFFSKRFASLAPDSCGAIVAGTDNVGAGRAKRDTSDPCCVQLTMNDGHRCFGIPYYDRTIIASCHNAREVRIEARGRDLTVMRKAQLESTVVHAIKV